MAAGSLKSPKAAAKTALKTVTADGSNQSFLSSFGPFAACWFLAFAVCARSFM